MRFPEPRSEPFYIVTQTALVEAHGEIAAAQKALSRVSAAEEVPFAVKFDSEATKLVRVQLATNE